MRLPDGYLEDAKGRLVPVEMIPPLDLTRDGLVRDLVEEAKALHTALAAFKTRAFDETEAFVALSGEEYGVRIGGEKGNVTLHSLDGRYRVERSVADYLVFDERLQVARALIDTCIREWTDGSRSEVKALVDFAFKTNSEGRVSAHRVLGLRRLAIEHPTWKQAMEAITDSMQVAETRRYFRIYERDEATRTYRPLSLNLASV